MAKQYLLPNTKQFKANLHCHTTFSDGKLSPEKMKEEYMKRGYSIIAYTDHDYIANHQELTDDKFIAITAYEYAIDEIHWSTQEWVERPNCHMNFYAKDPYQDKHVWFHPKNISGSGEAIAHELKYVGELVEHKTLKDMQSIIDAANENGFLVCFNHPYWSMLTHEDYFHLNGLFAMEVYNTGSEATGEAWYDYNLLSNLKPEIAPIAADDNHNHPNGEVENNDSFGGYTMICTDDFSYGGIISAMERRDFYASTGINIKEISRDGDNIHCEFDEATFATPYFGGRRWWDTRKDENGFASADFKIYEGSKHFRLLLENRKTGAKAVTRTFILD